MALITRQVDVDAEWSLTCLSLSLQEAMIEILFQKIKKVDKAVNGGAWIVVILNVATAGCLAIAHFRNTMSHCISKMYLNMLD